MTDLVKFYTMDDDSKEAYLASLPNEEFNALVDDGVACIDAIEEASPIYDEMFERQKKNKLFAVMFWRLIIPGAKAKAEAAYKNLESKINSIINNTSLQSLKELINIENEKLKSKYPNVPTDAPVFCRVVMCEIKDGITYKSLISKEMEKREE